MRRKTSFGKTVWNVALVKMPIFADDPHVAKMKSNNRNGLERAIDDVCEGASRMRGRGK
jgi:hypothetical protein